MGIHFFLMIILSSFAIATFGGGIVMAYIYQSVTRKNIKLLGWIFAPFCCLILFLCLFFVEWSAYSLTSDTNVTLSGYVRANVNKDYYIDYHDVWNLMHEDMPEPLVRDVDSILINDDKIVVSTNDGYHKLYEVDMRTNERTCLDSVLTSQMVWNEYCKTHDVDKDNIYSCDDYCCKYRVFIYLAFVIFDLLLIFFLVKKYGRRYLIEDEPLDYNQLKAMLKGASNK